MVRNRIAGSSLILVIAIALSSCDAGEIVQETAGDRPSPIDVDVEPSWSGTGGIAFTHYAQSLAEADSFGFSEVRVFDHGNGECRSITPGHSPDWSPDGRELCFIPGSDVWVVDVGTGQTRQVTDLGKVAHPRWSPADDRILFRYAPAGEQGRLWTVRSDGSDLVDTGIEATTADWSPDGTEILFTSPVESGLYRVSVVAPATPALVHSTTPARARYPRWSPAGDAVLFFRFGAANLVATGVEIVDLSNGAATLVLPEAKQADWSPDGREIVYEGLGSDAREYDLWILERESGARRRLRTRK